MVKQTAEKPAPEAGYSEPRYILGKLLIGFDLIMLTGLVAYGLLMLIMWLI